VYENAAQFNPQRWLTEDEELLKRISRSFWAFGSGQRGCIAEYLAWLEMKVTVADLDKVWKTDIAEGFGDEEMRVDDQISSIVPVGRRRMLFCKRVHPGDFIKFFGRIEYPAI